MTSLLMIVSKVDMGHVWVLVQYLPLVTELMLAHIVFITRASQEFIAVFLGLVLVS